MRKLSFDVEMAKELGLAPAIGTPQPEKHLGVSSRKRDTLETYAM